jgi:DUF4097 and DUF4098 domain-containing protein YvlB
MRLKTMNKLWQLMAVALVALLPLAASARRAQKSDEPFTEEFHQTYPLTAGGRVSLSNINGKVKITGWDRNEVRVDAVKRARTQEALRDARIKVDAGAASVNIETEYDHHNWNREDGDRRHHTASVEYTLSVPRAARVEDINLVNGSLDIENLAGVVEASSVNGGVTARGLSGRVSLSVVNGRLEATLDSLSDAHPISLSGVNGQVAVTIPSDANAHVKASVVHGSISNDFGLPVREGRYVGRDLEGQLGAGGALIKLSNVNGGISIRRASDNKPLSQARNLLSETREAGEFDDEDDQDAAREATREAARAAREATRDSVETERERQRAERDMEREVARAAAEATRESARIAREVQREARNSLPDAMRDDGRRQMERDSATLATKGAPRVRVETFDGSISIHAWDKPEVKATIIKRAFDEKEMKGIKVNSIVNNDAGPNSDVNIRADFDKSLARGAVERDGRIVSWNSGASVELDVYVPRNSTLIVSSGDGRLMVEGVRGEMELRTGDGSIDVTGAQGRLRANTGDGRILIEGFEGEADARTGDGRITLDGSFRQLSARTGDGTISLSLPDGLNATVETDAESVSNDGVAVAEDPNEEKRVRRWRIGNGGQVFTLRTGDGRVILQKR